MDLVALLYNASPRKPKVDKLKVVQVVQVEEVKGLEIDINQGTCSLIGITLQIGTGDKYGISLYQDLSQPDVRLIGVYDSLNKAHLEQMANDSRDATNFVSCDGDDD